MLDKEAEIIERLENGETLTKIAKDKDFPSLTTIYKALRADDVLHKKISKAREIGAYSYLDAMRDELDQPQDPKYFQQLREKLHHSRWLSSKLLSGTFCDKIKSEVQQDTKITVSWKQPKPVQNENDKKD